MLCFDPVSVPCNDGVGQTVEAEPSAGKAETEVEGCRERVRHFGLDRFICSFGGRLGGDEDEDDEEEGFDNEGGILCDVGRDDSSNLILLISNPSTPVERDKGKVISSRIVGVRGFDDPKGTPETLVVSPPRA